MRPSISFACLCLLLAGCAESPTGVPAAPVARTWIGTFANGTVPGDIVIDLVQSGDEVSGEVVFGQAPTEHLPVQGTLEGDSLQLATPATGFSFILRGRLRADASLEGHMAFSLTGLDADLSCRPLPRLRVSTELSVDVPYAVKAMVFDGGELWLSTATSDYVRMSVAGAIRDTVVVYYRPNTHWTSGALTSDGSRLWGFLPGTAISPSGSYDYSDLVSFNAAGRSPDSLRLWHRTGGLAYDGNDFWSLRADSPRLYRLQPSGVVVDSLQLGIPDAVHLEFDGQHFWTLGWYLKRLYQCNAAGETVAVGDLPGQHSGSFDGGLAVAGANLWYAESHAGYSTIHRLTAR